MKGRYLDGKVAIVTGARTAIFLATDDSVKNITGEYFYKCKVAKSSKRSKNIRLARKLSVFSRDLILKKGY